MDFPCTSCNQVLKRKESLRHHTRRFHPNTDEEPIKCLVCKQIFGRNSDLKKHTSKYYTFLSKQIDEYKETNKNDKSSERSINSETCEEFEKYSSIPSNNEVKNHLINYGEN